jgi:transposase
LAGARAPRSEPDPVSRAPVLRRGSPRGGVLDAAAKPPEFRRRAIELARQREKSIAAIAHDLGIAESCLRRWLKQDDIDAGRAEGLSTDERAELVRLRRENRVQAMEIEILKRASAYFAREAFPGAKRSTGWFTSSPLTASTSRWPAGC